MQPPLQPKYTLRGHSAPIHALSFVRDNTRLLTGDAEGWVAMWDTATKRPSAVWRAHTATVLGLGAWDSDKIITHGRDSKLLVWTVASADEHRLSKDLPVEGGQTERLNPWLLHSLDVNTLNFCSFAQCVDTTTDQQTHQNLLLATPGAADGSIVIYSLPKETIVSRISADTREKTGMLMTLSLTRKPQGLLVVAGFETGLTVAWQQGSNEGGWAEIYKGKSHAQPVLSLAMIPDIGVFFSSGADSVIARHHIDGSEPRIVQTMHAGQQGLVIRSDGRILATAGWDGRARIYSTKTLQELAVLKWHKEGCYAVAFADTPSDSDHDHGKVPGEVSGESSTPDRRTTSTLTVTQRRHERAQKTHWLALGSKDGKVSLWDVF
ncbi:WD domain-containing protein [Myriangium duriaei CBS 260.36]|uniref:ASTRA-associated protein 1 n=1 Tax=Myriangium duriaei CBS 260.36 TaxID=1168546 RepID=A0A9P4J0T0_9PEZI|nr:WD domain-containing protein [Myriangium duriaei CBS 260.36]